MKGWQIGGIVVWVLGLILIIATIIGTFTADKVQTIDLSAIEAQQITIGVNPVLQADFESTSLMSFSERSYDFVMVGVADANMGRLTYLGTSNGQYYKFVDSLSMGSMQDIREMRIIDGCLVVTYGKNMPEAIIFPIMAFMFSLFLGCAVYFKD